jgi:predicted nucleic acid-binding protein
MNGFVLDASIALSWCFADEANKTTAQLLDRVATETAIAPAIWPLELGNVLIGAERKKRITHAEVSEFVELIQKLNIEIDSETAARSFHDILSLAHSEKLTTYDAAYLELAMRKGLPLATKDLQLKNAAKNLGVHIIG